MRRRKEESGGKEGGDWLCWMDPSGGGIKIEIRERMRVCYTVERESESLRVEKWIKEE